ncbi:hypothetical protein LSS_22290 [Leptospira santarosai serovar Shermani str. LT 821]|uniref:Uncharacterized protein n=1 Tax=Leptospira santarosai serovar Shermani str. LT 821 TaxID=758847 RepID=A0A097ESS0_9LEPT|nr:hypothetical protein LSS_22290 [Leptospira santarosai serovar Shermani str. LT 821]
MTLFLRNPALFPVDSQSLLEFLRVRRFLRVLFLKVDNASFVFHEYFQSKNHFKMTQKIEFDIVREPL